MAKITVNHMTLETLKLAHKKIPHRPHGPKSAAARYGMGWTRSALESIRPASFLLWCVIVACHSSDGSRNPNRGVSSSSSLRNSLLVCAIDDQ